MPLECKLPSKTLKHEPNTSSSGAASLRNRRASLVLASLTKFCSSFGSCLYPRKRPFHQPPPRQHPKAWLHQQLLSCSHSISLPSLTTRSGTSVSLNCYGFPVTR